MTNQSSAYCAHKYGCGVIMIKEHIRFNMENVPILDLGKNFEYLLILFEWINFNIYLRQEW